ncbi:hypothetical protein [Nodularia chucula]
MVNKSPLYSMPILNCSCVEIGRSPLDSVAEIAIAQSVNYTAS